jgi:hypothetical protein
MAQSMPRPISGSRLVRLAAGDDSDEEEPFVPPHLAAGMAEPQVSLLSRPHMCRPSQLPTSQRRAPLACHHQAPCSLGF